ncbi:MAG TPA: hypothetical protein VGO91_10180 [Pyrinomonadaceae bacterium]|jgi:hypothetical protein|nr:hypothetical protein [Pyrinomonadaceae bacterium]
MSHRGEAARRQPKSLPCFLSAALCLLFTATGALAQSTEIDFPTPVRASEINAVILPRDVGDPRPTRHFYSLTGTPGDLIITVESKNLDGDVDLFTAGTLRPLAKISLYAGEAVTSASKSIYLKRREALILRIEARSPNEDQGGYRIRFEGGFEPITGEVATAPEANTPPASSSDRADQKTRRVTSVGARIEEPPPPVETVKAAEPSPTPQPSETARTDSTDNPTPTESRTNEPANKPKPPNRTARTARPARTRPTRVPKARPTPAPEKARTAPVEPVRAEAEPNPAPASPPASPRLIIETRDGMKVERFMSTVRRVTVEGGQVVIITKDGKVQRQPLTNILRMSIEP